MLPICRPAGAGEILGLVTTNMSLLRSLGRFLWALVGYKHVAPLGLAIVDNCGATDMPTRWGLGNFRLVTTNMSLLRSLGRFLRALVGYKHVVPLGWRFVNNCGATDIPPRWGLFENWGLPSDVAVCSHIKWEWRRAASRYEHGQIIMVRTVFIRSGKMTGSF